MQQIASAAAANAATSVVAVGSVVSIAPGGGGGGGTPNLPNAVNSAAVPPPVEPRFHVMDLNAASFSSLPPHLLTIPQVRTLTIIRLIINSHYVRK